MSGGGDAYALNEDGSAKDPVAFRKALLEDPAKMESLKEEPEVLDIVKSDDIQAFQELLKSVYQVWNLSLTLTSRSFSAVFFCPLVFRGLCKGFKE
jgi:hypothetical protein